MNLLRASSLSRKLLALAVALAAASGALAGVRAAAAGGLGPLTIGQQCGIADVGGGRRVRVPLGAPQPAGAAPLAGGDGVIDVSDMQLIASAYGASAPSPGYDGTFDLHAKVFGVPLEFGAVDILDVQAVYGRAPFPCVWYPPRFTTSRYITTLDSTTLKTLGCNQAVSGETGIVVIAFGAASFDGVQYGTMVYGLGFRPIPTIASAAESFIAGYADCALFLGGGTRITLAVGTSNDGNAVTYGHGVAWAQLIGVLRGYVAQHGYAAAVTVEGASDLESSFGVAAAARLWADGYSSAASGSFYYNFGDAAGCPPLAPACNWTMEDIWYVSRGVGVAAPLPEIYNFFLALQWQQVSLYGFRAHAQPLVFAGAMTQYAACLGSIPYGSCHGLGYANIPPAPPRGKLSSDNDPQQAWEELLATAQSDGGTWQPTLRYSTDITWDKAQ